MIDLVKLQEDWTFKLLSESALSAINIISLRKEVVDGKIDLKLLAKTKRNGRLGCGAVIEMPTFTVPQGNSPGPAGIFAITVLIAEMPTMNLAATSGTLLSAEDAAMRILDIGHRFFMRGKAEFIADKQAMEPAEFEPGHVAYRVRLAFLHTPSQSARVEVPTLTEVAGLVTLTCGTAGAEIYYTTDESFPGSANPTALRYEAPFQVESGTVLQFAAYKTGLTGSDVDAGTITI